MSHIVIKIFQTLAMGINLFISLMFPMLKELTMPIYEDSYDEDYHFRVECRDGSQFDSIELMIGFVPEIN